MEASSTSPQGGGFLLPENLGDVFDWSDRIENGETIIWMNDLEKDEMYKEWKKDLNMVNFLYSLAIDKLSQLLSLSYYDPFTPARCIRSRRISTTSSMHSTSHP
jgi:hypothetical protein